MFLLGWSARDSSVIVLRTDSLLNFNAPEGWYWTAVTQLGLSRCELIEGFYINKPNVWGEKWRFWCFYSMEDCKRAVKKEKIFWKKSVLIQALQLLFGLLIWLMKWHSHIWSSVFSIIEILINILNQFFYIFHFNFCHFVVWFCYFYSFLFRF